MKLKAPRKIEYPESDGKPMAETDKHRDCMVDTIDRLRWRYHDKKVYVSGILFVYYEEGNPRKVVAPDVFVVLNCAPRRRRLFKTWEEGKGPSWVLETTSRKSRREDTVDTKEKYALMRVREYFLYDPLAEWLKPPLQGFRLRDGDYEPIPTNPDGSLMSRVLGVRLVLEDRELVMYDANSGAKIFSKAEAEAEMRAAADQRANMADQRLQAEIDARKNLEEEVARLHARLGPGKNGGAGNGK